MRANGSFNYFCIKNVSWGIRADSYFVVAAAIANAQLKEKLFGFCIDQWDDEFMHEVQDELQGQKAFLDESQNKV